jgi:hypothetical protein
VEETFKETCWISFAKLLAEEGDNAQKMVDMKTVKDLVKHTSQHAMCTPLLEKSE